MVPKIVVSKIAACAVVAAALAAAPGANAQGISDDVVRIGVLSDMSSLYADNAGAVSVAAAQMAIDDFGGTVLGKKIELLSADHLNKADVGAARKRRASSHAPLC